jgi:hypothetical protein
LKVNESEEIKKLKHTIKQFRVKSKDRINSRFKSLHTAKSDSNVATHMLGFRQGERKRNCLRMRTKQRIKE